MRKLYSALCAAEVVMAGTFLMLMVALIFAGGVARMMGSPINWAMDVSTCLFAWACFLCADIAWRNGSLMSIDLLTHRLPQAAQTALLWINYLLIAAFLVFLIYAGFRLAWLSSARSFQGISWISYSWVTASLPGGACLLLLTLGLKVRRLARGEPEPAAS